MKSIFTTLLIILSFCAKAQSYWTEDFDNPNDPYLSRFIIDTVNYHNNVWQIGPPQKVVFNSARSVPDVIITDTLNPCMANDTSVFIIKHEHRHFGTIFALTFSYKLDIDSGTIAKVEVSGDSGQHWINVLTQDSICQFYWDGQQKPRLDTSVLDWTQFNLNMDYWETIAPNGTDTLPGYLTSDTVLFRFTFITPDSVSGTKDGWMMDDFNIIDTYGEAVKKVSEAPHSVTIYPNPSAGDFYIHDVKQNAGKSSAIIYNVSGQEVFRIPDLQGNDHISLPLPSGVYTLKYIADHVHDVQQIVIIR